MSAELAREADQSQHTMTKTKGKKNKMSVAVLKAVREAAVKGPKPKKKKAKGPKGGGGAGGVNVAAPAAMSVELKRHFREHPTKDGKRVVLRDVIATVNVPASAVTGGGAATREYSLNIPLVFSPNSAGRATAGTILPDIGGVALTYSRFRINSARLWWRPVCPSNSTGTVAAALVPDAAIATASSDELSAYSHSFNGAVWTPYKSDVWTAKEKRFYDNGLTEAATEPPQVTLVAVLSNFDSTQTTRYGQFWVDLDVEFIDPRPVPSTNIMLAAKDLAQLIVYGASIADNAVQYSKTVSGMGIWNWFKFGIDRWFEYNGTNYAAPISSMIDMDAGDFIVQPSIQLSAETAASEIQHTRASLTWDEALDLEEKEFPAHRRVFPIIGPAVRQVVICDFKNHAEARRARLAGYDPQVVARTLPNAAGDFQVNLWCQPRYSTDSAELLKQVVVSPGTGAFSWDYSWDVSADTGPCSYFMSVNIATSGQKRTLNSALLSVSMISSAVSAPHT